MDYNNKNKNVIFSMNIKKRLRFLSSTDYSPCDSKAQVDSYA